MEKINSSDDDIKGWLSSLPTKTSRVAVKIALTSVVGVPSLLAVLANITSYPIFSNSKEVLLIGALLLILLTCLVAFLVALISVVKHCRDQDERIKSLEKDLVFERSISMTDECTRINSYP
ncbi:hypothetical protein [Nitrosomonas sp. sh817]|uniref:hypothetical protein n=1 Tax=Nitrosomonas sp. sh817 TaxID=3070658 RepID=UPI0027DCD25C|nr:hypothetical protein [Nitrosomonas sp. sh817]WMJ09671.1 hypothetical protein RBH92_05615 [Nitrosomonas sp. sh817]